MVLSCALEAVGLGPDYWQTNKIPFDHRRDLESYQTWMPNSHK